MKSLHLILILFSIASMFTSFGVYDVDATHNGNGKSIGCMKGVATNNPHCDGGGGTSSTQFTICDSNWDDYIDNMELAAYGFSVTGVNYSDPDAASWIDIVDANGDDKIGDTGELRDLNRKVLKSLGFVCS